MMAAAETEFVRSRPEEDPEWSIFDACEFTDELAHATATWSPDAARTMPRSV